MRTRIAQANGTTRAQINNVLEKSHVIIIIINIQGHMKAKIMVLKNCLIISEHDFIFVTQKDTIATA